MRCRRTFVESKLAPWPITVHPGCGRIKPDRCKPTPNEAQINPDTQRPGDPRLYVCQARGALIRVSTCGSILGSYWVHFGSILGPFWVHCGSILGPFWVHFDCCLNIDAS